MVPVVVGIVALAVGIAAGFLIRKTMAASDAQSIEARAQKALLEAEREADATRVRAIQDAREESATIRREAEEDVRARREEISRLESRILESETDRASACPRSESKTLSCRNATRSCSSCGSSSRRRPINTGPSSSGSPA